MVRGAARPRPQPYEARAIPLAVTEPLAPVGLPLPRRRQRLVIQDVVADGGQGPGDQAGDVDLGDAQAIGDLGLGHLRMEAHEQNLLLTLGQPLQHRPHVAAHIDQVMAGVWRTEALSQGKPLIRDVVQGEP